MTVKPNDLLGIGHWPRWKQIAAFVLVIVVGLSTLEYAKAVLRGSSEARAFKAKMEPLAEQLVKAQKLGDKPAALVLAERTINIVNDYNALDDSRKAQINQSPLRYCVLAAVHLSSGPIEFLQTGRWVSQSQYDAALGECK